MGGAYLTIIFGLTGEGLTTTGIGAGLAIIGFGKFLAASTTSNLGGATSSGFFN